MKFLFVLSLLGCGLGISPLQAQEPRLSFDHARTIKAYLQQNSWMEVLENNKFKVVWIKSVDLRWHQDQGFFLRVNGKELNLKRTFILYRGQRENLATLFQYSGLGSSLYRSTPYRGEETPAE